MFFAFFFYIFMFMTSAGKVLIAGPCTYCWTNKSSASSRSVWSAIWCYHLRAHPSLSQFFNQTSSNCLICFGWAASGFFQTHSFINTFSIGHFLMDVTQLCCLQIKNYNSAGLDSAFPMRARSLSILFTLSVHRQRSHSNAIKNSFSFVNANLIERKHTSVD